MSHAGRIAERVDSIHHFLQKNKGRIVFFELSIRHGLSERNQSQQAIRLVVFHVNI